MKNLIKKNAGTPPCPSGLFGWWTFGRVPPSILNPEPTTLSSTTQARVCGQQFYTIKEFMKNLSLQLPAICLTLSKFLDPGVTHASRINSGFGLIPVWVKWCFREPDVAKKNRRCDVVKNKCIFRGRRIRDLGNPTSGKENTRILFKNIFSPISDPTSRKNIFRDVGVESKSNESYGVEPTCPWASHPNITCDLGAADRK